MDKKSIIILVVCFGLFVGMQTIVPKLFPPIPRPPAPTNIVASASAPGQTNGTQNPTTTAISSSPTVTPTFVLPTNVAEESLVFSNENARYTFTSHGGGLKLVELVHFPETVSRRRGKTETNHFATLNAQAPVPVLTIFSGGNFQGDNIFKLTQTRTGVRAEKLLPNGLLIVKEFNFDTNYLIDASIKIENTTTETVTLPEREIVIGTAMPMSAQDNGMAVGVFWYNSNKLQTANASWFTPSFMCMKREPRLEYREGSNNVIWAAVNNQFFTLMAMPAEPAQQVVAWKISLPPFAETSATNSQAALPTGIQAALVYPQVTLAPGQKFEKHIELFAGPKEYRTLAKIGDRFNNEADKVMNFGWFGFFSKALLWSMNGLHHTFYVPYGWAIILITVIIKVVFWPLTRASTRSMKRMQALQPQMKAIAEKYKDDPLKKNQKTMEFMKEHKVSPLGGCLPTLITIPVFIGFYQMIQSAIELRGAPFLWVGDLSKPDTLFMIPGFNFPFNLLPLLMGVTMFFQARMTPMSPGADPAQQKIMKYMPLMMLMFLYNFSAGLALYWTVQNLLTIAQMKITKTQPEPAPAGKPSLPQKR